MRKDIKLWGERIGHAQVRNKILAKEDVLVANEINDVETNLLLLKKWKDKWPSL